MVSLENHVVRRNMAILAMAMVILLTLIITASASTKVGSSQTSNSTFTLYSNSFITVNPNDTVLSRGESITAYNSGGAYNAINLYVKVTYTEGCSVDINGNPSQWTTWDDLNGFNTSHVIETAYDGLMKYNGSNDCFSGHYYKTTTNSSADGVLSTTSSVQM